MLQIPWVITMSIAATRMYRSLSDFLSSDVYETNIRSCLCSVLTVLVQRHGSAQRITPTNGRIVFENNGTSSAPIPLAGIQVVTHEAHEQHWTPQANHYGSNFSGQPELHEKPHELAMAMDLVCDHGIEGGAEK